MKRLYKGCVIGAVVCLSAITSSVIATAATSAQTSTTLVASATTLSQNQTSRVLTDGQATSSSQVLIDDGAYRLSEAQKQELKDKTTRLELPDVIHQVTYLTFGTNDENLNDTVEQHLKQKFPELIADNGDKFRDGNLIVAVGYDPRQNGIYCGDDVCDALDLWKGEHQDASVNVAKDYLREGKDVDALLASTRHAIDLNAAARERQEQQRSDRIGKTVGGVLGGCGVVAALAAFISVRRKKRRERTDQARKDYAFVMSHYADVAGRLDQIDIRANSLTSVLADAQMREQWADVRDRFVQLDSQVDSFRNIQMARDGDSSASAKKSNRLLFDRGSELATARETTEQLAIAEKNIDTMYQMEHGDKATRIAALNELKEDLVSAESAVTSGPLRVRVSKLIEQVEQLREETIRAESAGGRFMDSYALVLKDCAMVLDQLDREEFQDVKRSADRTPPKLYENDYRVGMGTYNYMPFFLLNSWHSADVQAHNDATASSSSFSNNTSFSSGFSGGGGSSGW